MALPRPPPDGRPVVLGQLPPGPGWDEGGRLYWMYMRVSFVCIAKLLWIEEYRNAIFSSSERMEFNFYYFILWILVLDSRDNWIDIFRIIIYLIIISHVKNSISENQNTFTFESMRSIDNRVLFFGNNYIFNAKKCQKSSWISHS